MTASALNAAGSMDPQAVAAQGPPGPATSPGSGPSTATAISSNGPWILGPVPDMLFACGGLVWALLFAHLMLGWGGGAAGRGIDAGGGSLLAVTGILLFADTHNAATIVRLYDNPDVRSKASFVAFWLPPAMLVLAVMALSDSAFLGGCLKVYTLFIAQHFTAQAYGIALLYCYKSGYLLGAFEKRAMRLLFHLAMITMVVRQFSEKPFSAGTLFGITLPSTVWLPDWTAGAAVLACLAWAALFAGLVILRALRSGQAFPLPAAILAATTLAAFTLGPAEFGVLWLYIPAFFHASQYLVVTTASNLKQNAPHLTPQVGIARRLASAENLRYWGLLAGVAICLYGLFPYIATIFGIAYQAAFATAFCFVNLHHFAADHVIWRMRDPGVRRLLVS